MSSWNRSPDSNDPAPTLGGRETGVTYTSWTEPEGLPSWLRPFNIDSRSRFTRTPEVLIKARSKGRDSGPEATAELAAPAPEPFVAAEPVAGTSEASSFVALPGTLEDDEVFIDWTGQTWAARIAAESAEVRLEGEGEVARAPEPDVVAADAVPTAIEETAPVAEAMVVEVLPEEAAIVESAPDAAAADVPVALAPDADLLPAIARLGRLILVAPAVPAPALDQDLQPPVVEAEPVLAEDAPVAVAEAVEPSAGDLSAEQVAAEPVAAVADAPVSGDIVSEASDAPVAEAVAGITPDEPQLAAHRDEAEPVSLSEAGSVSEAVTVSEDAPPSDTPASPEPVASEPAAAPEAPAAALPLAPVPFLGLGLQLSGALGWAFTAPAVPAPAPAPVEDMAPQILRRQVVPAEPVPVAPAAAEPTVFPPAGEGTYELPPLDLLTEPPPVEPAFEMSEEFLDRNSAVLQQTLRDFGVRGEVIDANPGPVVTLYEFEPAPGTKSSRVIGLSADIARSMSAVSARVAVVEGRNVIGIELPNQKRETVWLRELIANHSFPDARARLGICLGKTIGGEPVIVDLARMPHLLVAGTTGSGKSVAINTMILSLLYRLTPEQCRLIMIDPKMLELSVYEGIPHLLTPVVTDPKKAIIALQWAVREMEDRYRKMARLKVRNIEGFNARVAEAREKGEVITFTIERGFDRETGETLVEEATLDLTPLPYIVIIVDEMADLMMVAGKDIEGAIQRLAQMARAAGIHLVMATQRPSVDVITGTIKANFPTRISFQVTSKIDSRTILGEMGAETLLGQGDMLYMANGGRITRVHGPFVSDGEVEKVVAHLKAQGRPEYLDAVTADEEEDDDAEDAAVFDRTAMAAEDGGDHYEQAVAIVMRDRKASTSYIQRRLQIGYNKAASLMERMENEGIVGPANHAGKREILSSRQG